MKLYLPVNMGKELETKVRIFNVESAEKILEKS